LKPPTDPAALGLWAKVAATVRPFRGREVAAPGARPPAPPGRSPKPARLATRAPSAPRVRSATNPQPIEPGRHRRLARGIDDFAGATVDLHGLDQGRARGALTSFILNRRDQGRRAVLVITGKGLLGDGVLRRRVPEWLAQAPLREIVAGISPAHRRHGGDGAFYVALRGSRREGA
jgi:DNA-nicking Smr family endonuclease